MHEEYMYEELIPRWKTASVSGMYKHTKEAIDAALTKHKTTAFRPPLVGEKYVSKVCVSAYDDTIFPQISVATEDFQTNQPRLIVEDVKSEVHVRDCFVCGISPAAVYYVVLNKYNNGILTTRCVDVSGGTVTKKMISDSAVQSCVRDGLWRQCSQAEVAENMKRMFFEGDCPEGIAPQ